ncbi:MAG: hypothetical protein Q8N23_19300 [Archangium sp.]|nr:hypothetical protein [Archangium sp.]MDP3154834.1 hypothetical protein [Archangium sp.]MDP3575030.1 hypothetical protein [Archangium sp.]
MQKRRGLHDFQAHVFAERREFFEHLALEQRPADLDIVRNAGDIIQLQPRSVRRAS